MYYFTFILHISTDIMSKSTLLMGGYYVVLTLINKQLGHSFIDYKNVDLLTDKIQLIAKVVK